MRVTIKALGPLRDLLPGDGDSTIVDLPEGGTLADALQSTDIGPTVQWNAAIDGELVGTDRVLKDGDRLLIFAPIAGGSGQSRNRPTR
jgi:sulfur carrier protein ThiS